MGLYVRAGEEISNRQYEGYKPQQAQAQKRSDNKNVLAHVCMPIGQPTIMMPNRA